jgi:hypothetical protein
MSCAAPVHGDAPDDMFIRAGRAAVARGMRPGSRGGPIVDYGPVIARLRARWRHRSARSWSGVGFAVAGRITSVSYGMPMSWTGPKDSSVRRILLHDVSPTKRDFDCIGSINHDLGQDQGLVGCFPGAGPVEDLVRVYGEAALLRELRLVRTKSPTTWLINCAGRAGARPGRCRWFSSSARGRRPGGR